MKFSTMPKKRSRLQGHRKRRRSAEGSSGSALPKKLTWTEYKTVRQYQTLGDQLDMLRVYGHDAAHDEVAGYVGKAPPAGRNGHMWLTKERQ